jgi:hypothetical protein
VGDTYIIAKILFIRQSKYKTARDFEPALDEPQNQWAALGAAHQLVGQKPESEILVYLFESARTRFIKNI